MLHHNQYHSGLHHFFNSRKIRFSNEWSRDSATIWLLALHPHYLNLNLYQLEIPIFQTCFTNFDNCASPVEIQTAKDRFLIKEYLSASLYGDLFPTLLACSPTLVSCCCNCYEIGIANEKVVTQNSHPNESTQVFVRKFLSTVTES